MSTTGWYLNGFLHRRGMGPFTAVVRGESLDYTAAPPRARAAKRLTLGTRVRLPGPLTLQLNYLRQRGDLPYIKKHRLQRDLFAPSRSFISSLDHQITRSLDP